MPKFFLADLSPPKQSEFRLKISVFVFDWLRMNLSFKNSILKLWSVYVCVHVCVYGSSLFEIKSINFKINYIFIRIRISVYLFYFAELLTHWDKNRNAPKYAPYPPPQQAPPTKDIVVKKHSPRSTKKTKKQKTVYYRSTYISKQNEPRMKAKTTTKSKLNAKEYQTFDGIEFPRSTGTKVFINISYAIIILFLLLVYLQLWFDLLITIYLQFYYEPYFS